jgi:hypothetical protein
MTCVQRGDFRFSQREQQWTAVAGIPFSGDKGVFNLQLPSPEAAASLFGPFVG